MNKKIWYFKNNSEVYTVLYEDNYFILVMNDNTKLYSFGTKESVKEAKKLLKELCDEMSEDIWNELIKENN